MSFGLGRGRQLDPAPGAVGITSEELGPLPDEILTDPLAARVDPRRWFADPSLPLEIEIGSGKGTFLLQQAAEQPGVNFLGIEWAREFYEYAADRIRRRGLGGLGGGGGGGGEGRMGNIRMLNTDATEFLRWRCPDGIARVVHLYFSDPWPKKKHHRRRVVQDRFLEDVRRVLVPGGELRIVTDHEEYWAWMEEHFARWCVWGDGAGGVVAAPPGLPAFIRERFDPPESAGEGELVGTNFERKYLREGRPFRAATLRKPG